MEVKREPVVIGGERRAYAVGTSAVGAKGFVTLSGAVGENAETGEIPESIGEQTTIALTNIKQRLEEMGSSLENIMHIWWYLVGPFPGGISNTDEWKECARAIEYFWKDNCPEFYFKNNPPAGTLLGVTALAGPKLKIEIMVIAAIP
jgi:enamine deaminase RidA (YjgF/YER057c/UK114 family)